MLASQSPRRAELLRNAGIGFEVRPADVDERVRAGESPLAYVQRLAREKALQHEDRTAAGAELAARGSFGFAGVLAWAAIGIPFLIGVYIAIQKAAALF